MRAPLEGEYGEEEQQQAPPPKRKQCMVDDGSDFLLAAKKSELAGWRVLLNWLCGVEMDDGSGAVLEAPSMVCTFLFSVLPPYRLHCILASDSTPASSPVLPSVIPVF